MAGLARGPFHAPTLLLECPPRVHSTLVWPSHPQPSGVCLATSHGSAPGLILLSTAYSGSVEHQVLIPPPLLASETPSSPDFSPISLATPAVSLLASPSQCADVHLSQ